MAYLALAEARRITSLTASEISDIDLTEYLNLFDSSINYQCGGLFTPTAGVTERFYSSPEKSEYMVGRWSITNLVVKRGDRGNTRVLTLDSDYYLTNSLFDLPSIDTVTLLSVIESGSTYLELTGTKGITLPLDLKQVIEQSIGAKYAYENQMISAQYGTNAGVGAITSENDQSTSVSYLPGDVALHLADIASGQLGAVPSFARVFSKYRLQSSQSVSIW